MTPLEPGQPAVRRGSVSAARWRHELLALLSIGIPMGLTQLIQFSIHTIDVLMIGQLGAEPLAAAALGLVLFHALFVIGMGPANAVAPLVSHALGANAANVDDVRRSVHMGLGVVALGSALLALLFLFSEEFALALGQPASVARTAEPYVLALAPGLPFALGVMILRNFLAAIHRARIPLLIIVLTTALNAGLNYLLIYGHWGFPRLEVTGAGIATSIAHLAGFAALLLYIALDPRSREFRLFSAWTFDGTRAREIVRLGIPIGTTIAFEMLLFHACVFLMGRIGVDEIAAYQVALNVAAVAFMMPMGLSMAGSIRVGLHAGAGDRSAVRRAAAATIACSIGAIAIAAVPMALFPQWIAAAYLDTSDAANNNVLALVASFLPIAAAFALFDATQVAAAQTLRGLKDVRIPMCLTGVAYWMIGFPVAAWLSLGTQAGATGVWWGLLAGLSSASLLLGTRLYLITRH